MAGLCGPYPKFSHTVKSKPSNTRKSTDLTICLDTGLSFYTFYSTPDWEGSGATSSRTRDFYPVRIQSYRSYQKECHLLGHMYVLCQPDRRSVGGAFARTSSARENLRREDWKFIDSFPFDFPLGHLKGGQFVPGYSIWDCPEPGSLSRSFGTCPD